MEVGAHTQGESTGAGDDLSCVAEWLAQAFLMPMDAEQVVAARSPQGQAALCWMGELLGEPQAAERICAELSQGAAASVAVDLQRRHTALFGGLFRQHSVLPYASAWDGTGHLFGAAIDRMEALMRTLDVHIPENCPEPADHLAIQLACMAEALRRDNAHAVLALLEETETWSGRFASQLLKADEGRFYAATGQFLIALLRKIRQHHSSEVRQDTVASVKNSGLPARASSPQHRVPSAPHSSCLA